MPGGGGMVAAQRSQRVAPSAARASSSADVAAFALPREELLRNIRRFQARDKYCWTLPLACLGFILWCLALVAHADVETANQVEAGLNSRLLIMGYTDGSATVPLDTASYYEFLRVQVLDVVVPDDSGVVNRYGRLLGGVRVSQSRGAADAACASSAGSLRDVLDAVVGATVCFPAGGADSLDAFGDEGAFVADVPKPGEFEALCTGVTADSQPDEVTFAVPLAADVVPDVDNALDICNASVAQQLLLELTGGVPVKQPHVVRVNVTAAFRAAPPAQLLAGQDRYLLETLAAPASKAALPSLGDAFAWTFDYYSTSAGDTLDALAAGGWVDAATRRVNVVFAVLSPELGHWARVLLTTVFTRGGRVTTDATVRSTPVDPYGGAAGGSLVFLDLIVLAWVVVYWLQCLQHVARKCRRARQALADGRGGWHAARTLSEPWLLLDVGTGVGFVVTLALWGKAVTTLRLLRAAVTSAAWSPAAVVGDTFVAQAWIETAVSDVYSAKVVGTETLAALMLRLFWQFSLQPKLAVLSETLSRSLSDILHFVVLFTVVLAFYGMWGHVFFGGQLDRWRTPGEAAWGILSFLAYDYDLTYMQAVDKGTAKFFFGSFMFLVTNLLLWMFLAIIFDYYSEVRTEVSRMPSALDDLVAGGSALPGKLRRVRGQLMRASDKCCGGGRRTGGVMSARRVSRDSDADGSGTDDDVDAAGGVMSRSGRHLVGLGGGGSAAAGAKVSARRVVELLASEAYAEREVICIGDIASSLRKSLPDVVRFLGRFIALPPDLEAAAAVQAASGLRSKSGAGVGGGGVGGDGAAARGGGGGGGGGSAGQKFSFGSMMTGAGAPPVSQQQGGGEGEHVDDGDDDGTSSVLSGASSLSHAQRGLIMAATAARAVPSIKASRMVAMSSTGSSDRLRLNPLQSAATAAAAVAGGPGSSGGGVGATARPVPAARTRPPPLQAVPEAFASEPPPHAALTLDEPTPAEAASAGLAPEVDSDGEDVEVAVDRSRDAGGDGGGGHNEGAVAVEAEEEEDGGGGAGSHGAATRTGAGGGGGGGRGGTGLQPLPGVAAPPPPPRAAPAPPQAAPAQQSWALYGNTGAARKPPAPPGARQ